MLHNDTVLAAPVYLQQLNRAINLSPAPAPNCFAFLGAGSHVGSFRDNVSLAIAPYCTSELAQYTTCVVPRDVNHIAPSKLSKQTLTSISKGCLQSVVNPCDRHPTRCDIFNRWKSASQRGDLYVPIAHTSSNVYITRRATSQRSVQDCQHWLPCSTEHRLDAHSPEERNCTSKLPVVARF